MSGKYIAGNSPWTISDLPIDYAFPCATQNEIDSDGASLLLSKGAKGVFEGVSREFSLVLLVLLRKYFINRFP